MIETNKEIPSIVLAVQSDSADLSALDELFNGIEEEEIPVSVETISEDFTVQRAYEAALRSRLAVGIAYDNDSVIVHYKNLKEMEPLFSADLHDHQMLRALGSNAARLVKGTPFKLPKGIEF